MFTLDKTEGFTKKQIEELNRRLEIELEKNFTPDENGEYSEDDIKNASDRVSNAWKSDENA